MKNYLLLIFICTYSIGINAQNYCTSNLYSNGCAFSTGGTNYDISTSNVTIGTFSNTTGCSTGGYGDFTSTIIPLNTSLSAYNISVSTEFMDMQAGIWVDWNDDGDFNDNGEFIDSTIASFSQGTPWTSSLTIDSTRPVGVHRLRIRTNYSGTLDASTSCSSLGFGETEDYSISVLHVSGSCNSFTDVQIDSITGNTAKVSWTQGSGTSSFTLEYGLAGFVKGTGTTISGNYPSTSEVSLAALAFNTSYDVYLTEYCNSVDSSYMFTPLTFKTTLCASTPTLFNLDRIKNDSAFFSWNQTGSYQNFTLVYGSVGFDPKVGGTSITAGDTFAGIGGLSAATSYQVYLFTNCQAGNGTSDTIGPLDFRTKCTPSNAITLPSTEDFALASGTFTGSNTAVYCSSSANWGFQTSLQQYGTVSFDKNFSVLATDSVGVTIETNTIGKKPANLLIGYFNLNNYDTSNSSSVTLSFDHLDHWDDGDATDKVFVRESDDKPWLVLYDLDKYGVNAQWVAARNLNITDTLKSGGQNFSSDFQIAFGQEENENSSQIGWSSVGAGGRSFDNILLEEKSCIEILDVRFSNIDSNNAWIYVGDTSTSFEYRWGPCGFNQATATLHSSSSGYHQIINLPAGQCIDLYLSKDCGTALGKSIWTGPFSFRTDCGYEKAPFIEQFQSIAQPPQVNLCFSSIVEYIDPYGFRNDKIEISINPSDHVPGYTGEVITFNNANSDANILTLISPAFSDLDSTKQLTIDLYAEGVGSDLIIGTMSRPEDTSSFTPYDTILASDIMVPNNWEEFIIRFDRYKGSHKHIALRHKTGYRKLHIDNFRYERIPSCIPPQIKYLGVKSIGDSYTTVKWDANSGGSKTYISWGTVGFQPGSSTSSIDSVQGNVDEYTITGLMPKTKYFFYVQDNCDSDGKTAWIGPYVFVTKCDPIHAPYVESFEGMDWGGTTADSISPCWSRNGVVGDQKYTWRLGNGSTGTTGAGPDGDNTTGTGNYLYTEGDEGANGDTAWIYTPFVDISNLTNAEFSFYVHRNGFHFGQPAARLLVEINDGDGWDTLYIATSRLQYTPSAAYLKVVADISSYGDTVQVRFSAVNKGIFCDNAIDDISFDNGSIPCPQINAQSVSTTAVSDTGALLSWSGGASATAFQIQIKKSTDTVWNIFNVAADSIILDTLTPETCYSYSVRSLCGNIDTSLWVGPFNFCTLPSCIQPTGLGIDPSSFSASGLDIFWTGGGASDYNIEYGFSGFALGTGNAVNSTNDTLSIGSLQQGTRYDFYVRDSCAVGDVSYWTGPYTFTSAFLTNYFEGFTASSPIGWERKSGSLSQNTVFSSNYSAWFQNSFGNLGSNQGRLVTMGTSSKKDWYLSPSIFLDTVNKQDLQIEFDAAVTSIDPIPLQGYFNPNDSIYLVVSTDNGISWSRTNVLWTASSNDTIDKSGEHFIVPLTGLHGYVRFGFYATNNGGFLDSYFFIDNFEVREPRLCPSPFDLAISAIGRDSVVATWDYDTTNFISTKLINVEAGKPIDSGTVYNGLLDSVVVSNLSAGQSYCAYIVSECGFGNSDTIGPICYTTDCPVQSLPYYEDFNASLGCFIPIDGGNTTDTWERILASTDWIANPTPFARVSSDEAGFGADLDEYLVSPEIDAANATNLKLTFDHYFFNYLSQSDLGFVEVYDGSQWQIVKTYNQTFQGVQDSIDISAYKNANLRVRFRYINSGDWAKYWAIDNVSIKDYSCLASDFKVDTVGCDSVGLSWNSQSGQSVIKYTDPAGTTQYIGTVTSPYVLKGLQPGTPYSFGVADVCNGDTSNFLNITKTTLSGPLPFAFFTINTAITNNGQTFEVYVDASSSANGTSYSWDFGNATGTGVKDTAYYTIADNGFNTVTLVVSNGCGSDTLVKSVFVNIGLEESSVLPNIEMYPNPTSNKITVQLTHFTNKNLILSIVDAQGRMLYTQNENPGGTSHSSTIDVSHLRSGVYFMQINLDGVLVHRPFVIE